MAIVSRQPPISVKKKPRACHLPNLTHQGIWWKAATREIERLTGGISIFACLNWGFFLDWLETSGSYKYSLIFKFLWESSRKPGNLRRFCLLLLSRLWLLLAHECSLPVDWENPAFSLRVSQMSFDKKRLFWLVGDWSSINMLAWKCFWSCI